MTDTQPQDAVAVTQAARGKLLPCPFCGQLPNLDPGANDYPWVVECVNADCPVLCAVDGKDTRREAIAAWNTRLSSTPVSREGGEPVAGEYPKSIWYTPFDNSSRRYIRDDIAEGWEAACENLIAGSADDRDRSLLLAGLLERAREYVTDSLEAHEHSGGRDLLREIDAALTPTSREGADIAAVVEREDVERDIRIAIWNAGMNGGMGQDLTQAFINRAMAEPLMQRALAALEAPQGEVGK